MMDDEDEKLRKTAELINEGAGIVLAATNPWTFGRRLVELLLRIQRKEPIPGLPEYMIDWLNDVALDLRAHNERLFALESDRGRTMVFGNYGEAAWREASDLRRVMLGDAAVATILSELTPAELARVERTIRMLDPEDLQLLNELRGVWEETEVALEAVVLRRDDEGRIIEVKYDEHGRRPDPPSACYEHLVRGHLEGAALLASGCVQPMPSQGVSFAPQNIVQVSALGWLVLRFMGRGRGAAPRAG